MRDATTERAARQAAKLAEDAADATGALRAWLATGGERRAALRAALDASAHPALYEDVRKLLQDLVAIHFSFAELGARPDLASGLLAAVRYSTARRAFGSDTELADTLEVHRSQITRWKQGAPPDPENAERLVGLDAVVSLLKGFLEDASIPKWLRGINAHLDNRKPIDVLREGRLSEVIRAIEAEKSGAFA